MKTKKVKLFILTVVSLFIISSCSLESDKSKAQKALNNYMVNAFFYELPFVEGYLESLGFDISNEDAVNQLTEAVTQNAQIELSGATLKRGVDTGEALLRITAPDIPGYIEEHGGLDNYPQIPNSIERLVEFVNSNKEENKILVKKYIELTYNNEKKEWEYRGDQLFSSALMGDIFHYYNEISFSIDRTTQKRNVQRVESPVISKENKTTLSDPEHLIPIGEKAFYDNMDMSYDKKKVALDLSVEVVMKGDEAKDFLLQNSLNVPEIGSSKELIVIKMLAVFRDGNKSYAINPYDFQLANKRGLTYQMHHLPLINARNTFNENGTLETYIIGSVPEGDDTCCLVYNSYLKNSIWFRVRGDK